MREDFLKACEVDVETENLRGEGMLGGEVFGTPDALLPGSGGHRAIMGLGPAAGKFKDPSPRSHRDKRKPKNLKNPKKLSPCLCDETVLGAH